MVGRFQRQMIGVLPMVITGKKSGSTGTTTGGTSSSETADPDGLTPAERAWAETSGGFRGYDGLADPW